MKNLCHNRRAAALVLLSAGITIAAAAASMPAAAAPLIVTPLFCLICFAILKSLSTTHRAAGILQRFDTSELVEVYRSTTQALASAIAAKDLHARDHVNRVGTICELVAIQLGLDQRDIDGIRMAALVHDIGNMGVPEYILLKPGPLDPDEFCKMSSHAVVGSRMLEQVHYPWDITGMVRHHHEKWDGSGYPDHLSEEQIPLGSRIIYVAEVYDALLSDRTYRAGWRHEDVVDHISRLSGTHFDPWVVKAFLEVEPNIASLVESHNSESLAEDETLEAECAAEVIAQANGELVSLFEIATTLSSTLETEEVLTLLAHRTKRLVNASTCVVFMLDESDPKRLRARAAVGRHQKMLRSAEVTIGEGVTGRAAEHKQTYIGCCEPGGEASGELQSCMVAPIVSDGRLIGAINLYDVSADAFTRDDLRMLTVVANQAALAIQNASVFEGVRDSALRDPLTGLHNRRYLFGYLEHELSRARRRGEPLSVLAIDLDNFKVINDICGHGAGDEVLRDVAGLMLRELRDYDVVIRNGGDEFVIVLPGTPASEAAHTAERIRQSVSRYARLSVNPGFAGLGASVGVASFPDDAGDLETLLDAADAAMYRDKRARKQGELAA